MINNIRTLSFIAFIHTVLPLFDQKAEEKKGDIQFIKHIITSDFISEGITAGDVNNDGRIDIIAGAYWFEGPTWVKHEISEPQYFSPSDGYSNSFLNFNMDVDQDGWIDVIRIGLPGEEAVWYENPKNNSDHWRMHYISRNIGNESPAFFDVDGDGRPDIICNDPVAKEMIWLKSPEKKGDTVWQRFVIGRGSVPGLGRYTHGLGFADMNGDGRADVIITKGWWEMPADPKLPDWLFHPADFGEDCSQIYFVDVNDDGKKDLISASAHRYGIWWHEKKHDDNGNEWWQHHTIFDKFSQTHGLAVADINGDGHPDLVTGKRYFAHNQEDPGAFEPAVLYWFESKPKKPALWIPHLIDSNSGVGLQVVVQDINQDGLPDIIVCNKKGLFYFERKK